MAEPLTREGPIDVLDSAVCVLRQAGLGALLLHWTGSVPFALGLLLVRKQVTNPRTTDLACAVDALALVALLIWMNCWRAAFAGRVRRQLMDDLRPRQTLRGLIHLIAVQALACGTKLLVLPFAALIVFPLPQVVAFYRNAAVLAGGPLEDPRGALTRARQLARFQPELSWVLLPLFCFLGLVVWLNVLVAIGALPQLVRILTGYESTFSRSGWFFVANKMFILLTLCIAWLLFDPFVQTVYCVRCYQAESLETGEDLRGGIRRLRASQVLQGAIRSVAIVGTLLLAMALPGQAALPPLSPLSSASMEQASRIALRSAEYDWRLPPPPSLARNTPWIVSLTDRILASTKKLGDAVGSLVDRFFKWLGSQLGGAEPRGGALPVRGMHWTVWAAIAIATAAGIFMAMRVLRSRRVKAEPAAAEGTFAIRLDAEDLTADRLPEDQWLALAERSLLEENLRLALRAFYLASLAWMGRAEFISIHPGKTNREYELELRRRSRAFPEAGALFGTNVLAFEKAWYGLREVAMDEITEFRRRVAEMKSILPHARGLAT
jgi:Domain of unknown function (DUF4129)